MYKIVYDNHIDLISKIVCEQELKDNELNFRFRYDQSLFDTDLMQNFVTIYERIFSEILNSLEKKEDDKKISAIDLLTEEDTKTILHDFNTISHPITEKNIVSRFEDIVSSNEALVALKGEFGTVSYQELNARSNRLASYLHNQFMICAEDLIPLFIDKSEYTVLSILAVLKSRAAYVPISTDIPKERVQYILSDTSAKVVLTTSSQIEALTDYLGAECGISIIAIDDAAFENMLSEEYSSDNLNLNIQGSQLAYVIYTSGTTGMPKGVMVEHRNVVNLFVSTESLFGFDTDDVWTLFHSYSFDFSVWEIWGALLYGGSLIIPSDEVIKDSHLFYELCIREGVSVLNQTPQAFYQFMDVALSSSVRLKSLRYVIFGGDSLNLSLLNPWYSLYAEDQPQLVNMYGITETTVHVTYKAIKENDLDKGSQIGRPINSYQAYILDDQMHLLPKGAIGELYIGGNGIARGYLNNASLTSERFIKNPFTLSADRLYKSGDLGRYLSDGSIEYIGRNDFQVKIRGYRIELGEIESCMISYPKVRNAAVIVKENKGGTKVLIGYYLSEKEIGPEQLRAHLECFLPDYMIPIAFIHLEVFPTTENGKLDRTALSNREVGSLSQSTYVAPVTDEEHILCSLFGEVLGLDNQLVGVEDDFFKLGGDSISAIKLSMKIYRKFEKSIHVSTLFTCRTVRKISLHIRTIVSNSKNNITPYQVNSKEEQLLSFAQERVLFLDSYQGGSNEYNISMVYQIKNTVDMESFLKAIEVVVSRHEALHTYIKTDDQGNSFQIVSDLDREPLPIEIQDVNTRDYLDDVIFQTVNRIFKLDIEYPIHIALYKLAKDNYISIVLHHIAFDGWSGDIFLKEINSYYNYLKYLKEGDPKKAEQYKLPEIEIHYKDFALWQRNYLTGEVLTHQLSYWKNHLSGYETLNLPTDKTRPSAINYTGADVSFLLDANSSNNLRQTARDLDVSLHNLMLSAYYIFLSAYSNQKDIVIGLPIAGRNYKEIINTIGLFVNTLALRQLINLDETIIEFIMKVSQSVNEAHLYQDLPFEKLVEELDVEKDSSRTPIIQVMFNIQSFGKEFDVQTKDLLEPYTWNNSLGYSVAKLDLTTTIDDTQECISGNFNYAVSLFNKNTIEGYISTYISILKQFAQMSHSYNKAKKIKEINYTDHIAYEELVNTLNNTRVYYDNIEETIHQMFEKQVRATPDNIALVYGNTTLTYKQLNLKANQLAAYLIHNYRIQPNDSIMIFLERNKSVVISILAILKTGAAYVPLEASTPDERILFMVEDTHPRVILSQESLKDKLNSILLDDSQDIIFVDNTDLIKHIKTNCSATNIDRNIHADNLAYIIYTSGTSGKPKGAMIAHKGVINLVKNMIEIHKLNQYINIGCYSNCAFDAFVYETLPALCNGNSLYLYSDNIRTSLDELAAYIKQEHIEVTFVPPAFLVDLSRYDIDIKVIYTGGELFPSNIDIFVPYTIINEYGPTETTVCVTYNPNVLNTNNTNIGRPISNTTLYVLDEYLRLLPKGAIGELYIGGCGVAQGYLNQPLLTEKHFISNPFLTENDLKENYNTHIYKTGDLVRYSSTGDLEYMGRNDFQVKMRGFRIELAEIELCMNSYPEIRNSVVVAKDNTSGMKYLVGYYVAPNKIDDSLLSNYLNRHLPEHMIPTVFAHLRELPITSNGKIDRRSLPEPEINEKRIYIEPENEIEESLRLIFAEVLNLSVDEISTYDDFFKLNGNSILAIRLVAKINKAFETNIKLTDIFSCKTVRNIAPQISLGKKAYDSIVELNTSENENLMFMIHPAAGGSEVYSSLAENLSLYFHCYGVDWYNLYNHNNLINDLDELSNYYLSNINRIHKSGAYTILGWSLGGQIALYIASILESRGETNITIYLLDTILTEDDPFLSNERMNILDKNIAAIADLQENASFEEKKILEIAKADTILSMQSLPRKLRYTKVLLFKAVEKDASDDEMTNHIYSLKFNNVDRIVESLNQIDVIVLDCNHALILKEEKRIIDEILVHKSK